MGRLKGLDKVTEEICGLSRRNSWVTEETHEYS